MKNCSIGEQPRLRLLLEDFGLHLFWHREGPPLWQQFAGDNNPLPKEDSYEQNRVYEYARTQSKWYDCGAIQKTAY